jgi:RsiW-degrading membrane proteinase PrsW (M82 family)
VLHGAHDLDPCRHRWETELKNVVRHIVLPLVAPAAILGLYFTPTTVVACATRGLLALAVVLVSAIGAFVAIGFGFRAQRRSDPSSSWWIATAAILTTPLALLLGPLG